MSDQDAFFEKLRRAKDELMARGREEHARKERAGAPEAVALRKLQDAYERERTERGELEQERARIAAERAELDAKTVEAHALLNRRLLEQSEELEARERALAETRAAIDRERAALAPLRSPDEEERLEHERLRHVRAKGEAEGRQQAERELAEERAALEALVAESSAKLASRARALVTEREALERERRAAGLAPASSVDDPTVPQVTLEDVRARREDVRARREEQASATLDGLFGPEPGAVSDAELDAAREHGGTLGATGRAPPPEMPGFVAKADLDAALEHQARHGGTLGDALVTRGAIGPADELFRVAERAGLDVIDLDEVEVEPAALELIPATFARTYRVIPVEHDDQRGLLVALGDPERAREVLDDLRFMLNLLVRGAIASPDAVDRALRRLYGSARAEPGPGAPAQDTPGPAAAAATEGAPAASAIGSSAAVGAPARGGKDSPVVDSHDPLAREDDAPLREDLRGLLSDAPVTPPSEGLRARTRDVARQLARTASALPAGAKVGPYVVRGVLGHGGQATVYRAEDAQGRAYALKVPRPELVTRLVREAQILFHLDHPHILRIEKAAIDVDPPYIATELLEGTLADRLREGGRLPPAEVAAIADQVLRALAYGHEKGVVHRDIKPSNVLFDREGKVKLADFGVGSLRLVEDLGLGQTLVSLDRVSGAGTPVYMAPEQEHAALRQDGKVDGRADLYALGKLLYEALTGRSPRTVRPASALVPGLDPAWDAFLFCMVEDRPEDRFHSASEARRALGALRTSAGPSAPPTLEALERGTREAPARVRKVEALVTPPALEAPAASLRSQLVPAAAAMSLLCLSTAAAFVAGRQGLEPGKLPLLVVGSGLLLLAAKAVAARRERQRSERGLPDLIEGRAPRTVGRETLRGALDVLALTTTAGVSYLAGRGWIDHQLAPLAGLLLVLVLLVRLLVFARRDRRRGDVQLAHLTHAAFRLSKQRRGALIALERGRPIVTSLGTPLDTPVHEDLIVALFGQDSPLRDGAVIVRGDRLVCAGAYLRLTEWRDLPPSLGSRHRAALSASKVDDALVIVVCDATGAVSLADRGQLRPDLTPGDLASALLVGLARPA